MMRSFVSQVKAGWRAVICWCEPSHQLHRPLSARCILSTCEIGSESAHRNSRAQGESHEFHSSSELHLFGWESDLPISTRRELRGFTVERDVTLYDFVVYCSGSEQTWSVSTMLGELRHVPVVDTAEKKTPADAVFFPVVPLLSAVV